MSTTESQASQIHYLSIQIRLVIWAIITIFLCGVAFCSGSLAYRVKLVEDSSRFNSGRIDKLEKATKSKSP